MYHPLKLETIERNIVQHQTGTASEMTVPERLEMLDGEIKKNKSWIEFYNSPRGKRNHSDEWLAKTITVYQTTIESLAWKRERLLAIHYHQTTLPMAGGAMKLAGRP